MNRTSLLLFVKEALAENTALAKLKAYKAIKENLVIRTSPSGQQYLVDDPRETVAGMPNKPKTSLRAGADTYTKQDIFLAGNIGKPIDPEGQPVSSLPDSKKIKKVTVPIYSAFTVSGPSVDAREQSIRDIKNFITQNPGDPLWLRTLTEACNLLSQAHGEVPDVIIASPSSSNAAWEIAQMMKKVVPNAVLVPRDAVSKNPVFSLSADYDEILSTEKELEKRSKLSQDVWEKIYAVRAQERQAQLKGEPYTFKSSKMYKPYLRHLKGGFTINPEKTDLQDKKVMIVDEVVSSGFSLKEIARDAYKLGAKDVWGATLWKNVGTDPAAAAAARAQGVAATRRDRLLTKAADGEVPTIPYSPNTKYNLDDVIEHPTFGTGVVSGFGSSNNVIVVSFPDAGTKNLKASA